MNHGYFSDTSIVISVNARALQGGKSTVCGHYCILFLYLCARVYLGTLRAQSEFALEDLHMELLCKSLADAQRTIVMQQ